MSITIEEKIGNISETQLIRGTIACYEALICNDVERKILLINESLETMKTKSESEIETTEEVNEDNDVKENTDLENRCEKKLWMLMFGMW